jgi:hypothetical protein
LAIADAMSALWDLTRCSEADDHAGFSGYRPVRAFVRVFEGRDFGVRRRSAELRRLD